MLKCASKNYINTTMCKTDVLQDWEPMTNQSRFGIIYSGKTNKLCLISGGSLVSFH